VKFVWDPATGRYRDSKGLFVPRLMVRKSLDRVAAASGQRMRIMGQQVSKGEVSLADFHVAMRTEVKSAVLNNAAAAKGGYAQLTQSDYGRIGNEVKRHYTALDKFVTELYGGVTKTGTAGFASRVQLYFNTARAFYYKFDREAQETAGMTQERNLLHPAEHCAECLAMSAIGWVAIGTLVPIGERECVGNDRCTMEYRRAPND
jgi:hypothetical protein